MSVPAVAWVAHRFSDHYWMVHALLFSKTKVTEGIVKYLLLVGKVKHQIPVKLVSQG